LSARRGDYFISLSTKKKDKIGGEQNYNIYLKLGAKHKKETSGEERKRNREKTAFKRLPLQGLEAGFLKFSCRLRENQKRGGDRNGVQ